MDKTVRLGKIALFIFLHFCFCMSQEIKDDGAVKCWSYKPYLEQSSGSGFVIYNETYTEDACRDWCRRTDLCAAAEYNKINKTCSVNAFSQVGKLSSNECCNYYDKIPNPECSESAADESKYDDSSMDKDLESWLVDENYDVLATDDTKTQSNGEDDTGTTARTTVDHLPNIERDCIEEVDTMMEMAFYSQYGGARLSKDEVSQEQCADKCLNRSDCVAVDYNIWEKSCWILTKTNKNTPLPNNCCNHHIKVKTCLYDCFTIYMSKMVVSKPLQVFTMALSEEACQRKCLDISNCMGFQYNESAAECSLFDNITMGDGEKECCDAWVKRTCKGYPNDTFIYPTSSSETTTSENPRPKGSTFPVFVLPDVPKDESPQLPHEIESDESTGLLSPVSLVVLIGCVFVFIVGVVTLVGFIIHRKRERKLLESESYNLSSPSMWLSDFSGGGFHRAGGGYWSGDGPLDITCSSTADLRRHETHHTNGPSHGFDFRRLKDQRRRSFHATSPARDYSDTLDTFPLHHVRSLPFIDTAGLGNYPSFTCSGYKGLGNRLPRYGATGGREYPAESHAAEGYRNSGFYTGNLAYP